MTRKVYCVLSPRSLAYSRQGIQTLLLNCLDLLDITFITDSAADKVDLLQAAEGLANPRKHSTSVVTEEELGELEASSFPRHPNLRSFRHGHPCWRKITDPLLLGREGEELVILDPDVFFPNRFHFEQTPAQGLLLMWQRPNCLLPPDVVRSAMQSGIRLARHVDIGVAHWRAPADLDWLDWMLGRLGAPALPRVMHVEAIAWAAIAMREGGGYLDRRYWRCWQRTLAKRIMRRLGVSGGRILGPEPWQSIKCFHAGGEAKWWIADRGVTGIAGDGRECLDLGKVWPFIELTPAQYDREEAYKRWLRQLDYYQIFR